MLLFGITRSSMQTVSIIFLSGSDFTMRLCDTVACQILRGENGA